MTRLIVLCALLLAALLYTYPDQQTHTPAQTPIGGPTPAAPPNSAASTIIGRPPAQQDAVQAPPEIIPDSARGSAPPPVVATGTLYRQTAVAFLRDFARPHPGTPAQIWWARVATHLSADALPAYLGTDPAQVPFQQVTGPARLRITGPGPVVVRVPTDTGWWQVDLVDDLTGLHVSAARPTGHTR